jgi:GNAT superfamily N-acetyltransferase
MAIVRRARREDAPRLADLSRQLGYAVKDEDVAARLEVLLDHPDHAVFVTEETGGIVGWIQVSLSILVESPPTAVVGGLVVDERHRRRGIGPLLLREADAWAREKGATRLRVPCNVTRADAHRFYEREGFREVKKQKIFERTIG